jgi:hypothetical protein
MFYIFIPRDLRDMQERFKILTKIYKDTIRLDVADGYCNCITYA